MRKIMRYTGLFLLTLLMALQLLVPSAQAAGGSQYQNPQTGYQVFIQDDAQLVSRFELQKVIDAMKPITAYGGVAFVTSYDVSEDDTTSYAKSAFRRYFGRESGALFLIDMNNRQIYIFCDGAIYKTIKRSGAYTITDNVYTYATSGDYATCTAKAFNQILTMMEGGRVAAPMRLLCALLFSISLSLIITLIWAKYSSVTDVSDDKDMLKGQNHEQALDHRRRKLIWKEYVSKSSSDGSDGGGGGGGGSSGGGGGHGF